VTQNISTAYLDLREHKAIAVACDLHLTQLNMQAGQNTVDKLLSFKQRDKFSQSAWNKRGLNPSSPELCSQMTKLFDLCADNLIKATEDKHTSRQLKSVLKAGLGNFNKLDYDTEEKEFICDLFHELATIVNVDFNENLNRWLYGSVLTTLMKMQKILKPEKIVQTLRQPCTKCETQLETHILRKENGIPETSWIVAKCINCGELNLLSTGPNVKETRFGNYQWVDSLSMDEYTYQQALTRLEQIKFFRK
jgi:hypothetical protein